MFSFLLLHKSCTIENETFDLDRRRKSTLKAQVSVQLSVPSVSNGIHHSQSAPSISQAAHLNDDLIQICPKLQRELISDVAQQRRSARFYFLLNMCVCNTVMVRHTQKEDRVEEGYFEDNAFNVGNSAFFVPVEASQTNTSIATPQTAELTPSGSTRQFTFAPTELLKRIGSLSKIFQKRQVMAKAVANIDPTANFDAESPDELALVKAADAYGFTLSFRSNTEIRVRLPSTQTPSSPNHPTIFEDEIELEVLKVLPFDSNRKRMSIVVKIEDQILLLCKGADEQVIPNLDPTQNDPALLQKTKQILEDYGRTGLRTLCMAMKWINEEDFLDWLDTRELVESVIADESDELLSESSKKLETNMKLLGVTAIEDRLQDGVTECIDDLRMAGIQARIWVLTGDKCETAINIAKSCHLFKSHLQIIEFHTIDDVRNYCNSHVLINAVFASEIIRLMKEGNAEVFQLIKNCCAIVCFRMTPAEKAEVVKAVRNKLKGKTLAIGDGANDVPMILGSDVGVGISGREGLQAVMASDFAISRFRFLRKLLLVHGHWNYYRLSNAILYFLEKNAIFVLTIFWQQLFSGFSCSFLIDPVYSMLYPVLFVSVQPIVYSIFDQDVTRTLLLKYPHLYEQGREGQLCTTKAFAISMVDAFWQSAALFFIPYLCFEESALSFWQLAFMISTAMFFANSVHLGVLVRRWTTPLVIVFCLFAIVHFLFFMLYTTLGANGFGTKDPPLNVAFSMMPRVQFWTCILLTMTIALLPRAIVRLFYNQFWPDLCQRTIIEERGH
ncbi:Phospholipid-transporting ATPase [Aphelenchoides bicaudatus]|nr:Phospholipid-transporting ATPase [Aphelenchoides bicaudatus]